MKISKIEKIWLTAVLIFFTLYNLPGIPGFGDAKGLIIHGVLTVPPLWIIAYLGMYFVNRKYKLQDSKKEDEEEEND